MKNTTYIELSIIEYGPDAPDNRTGADEYHLYLTPLNLDMSNKKLILIDVYPSYTSACISRKNLMSINFRDLGEFLKAVNCEHYCYSHFHNRPVKLSMS